MDHHKEDSNQENSDYQRRQFERQRVASLEKRGDFDRYIDICE